MQCMYISTRHKVKVELVVTPKEVVYRASPASTSACTRVTGYEFCLQALPPPPMPFQPKKDRDKAAETKGKDAGKKGKEAAAPEKPKAKASPGKAKYAVMHSHMHQQT